MSRKLLGMVLNLGVLASLVLSAPSAYATYSVYLYQNGINVDATGSGTINTDIDMADVKPLEQKNHAVSLDTTKHTVSTGFPHVPFFSDS